jgi:hypothetical protein
MFRGGDVLRPHLFGHEWVGRVADIGNEVSRGVAVALKFIPMAAVGGLRFAWGIVREAARRNGGIL